MTSPTLKILFAALLLATAGLTAAIAGQLPFNVQVKPRLAKNHTLNIETEDGQISAAAQPGETIVQDVPRGLHTFYLVVKELKTGQEINRSAPLNLDVRRYIARP